MNAMMDVQSCQPWYGKKWKKQGECISRKNSKKVQERRLKWYGHGIRKRGVLRRKNGDTRRESPREDG